MRLGRRRRVILAGLGFLGMGAGLPASFAQDGRQALVPPGWHVRHVRVEGAARPVGPAGVRSLTVRPPFAQPAEPDADVFVEGGTVYGDISAFVPAPMVDSGVQFPYGFDGIGGYGSDLGFGAGHDSAVYDRGALDRARAVTAGFR